MLLYLYLSLACLVSASVLSSHKDQEKLYTVNILFHKIEEMQVQKSTESNSPFTPTRYKGAYESEWNLILNEPTNSTNQQTVFSVKDTDIFANAWITISILEAFVYGRSPKPSEDRLRRSIYSIARFKDKNGNISNSMMTIWPQKYDSAQTAWSSGPVNIMRLGTFMSGEKVGRLSRGPARSDVQSIIRCLTFSKDLFDVPPDFGSTFINIALGSVLRSMDKNFVGAYDRWASNFVNLNSVMTSLKYNAYRPFSSSDLVDTRTYFVLRKFLEAAKLEQNDVLLVPLRIFENETHGNGNSQPTRQTKTIDVTASASVLFGLTNMLLTGMVSYDVLDDPDIEKIYMNTSSMLTFLIRTNFSGRPDLALAHHPSEFQLYWSVARTLSTLRRHFVRHGLYHQALVAVMLELKEVLQGHCTDMILSAATTDGPDQVYFDDYHTTVETRLFSTAMAMNTLLSSWTVFDEGSGYLVWEEYTPADVRDKMEQAATWLNRHILGEKYRPGNELLSWRRHGVHHDPFPANVCLYVNGTTSPITPHYPCDDPLTSTRVVRGVVSAEWYQEQMKSGKTVEHGHGTGDSTDENIVWSSKALTYASSMYALACQCNTISYKDAYRRT